MKKHGFLRPVAVLSPISTRTTGIGVRFVRIAIQSSARTGESHGVVRKTLDVEITSKRGQGDWSVRVGM